jgi:hypothetical protein
MRILDGFLILPFISTAFLAPSPYAGENDHATIGNHMKLTGVISQVRSGVVLVDTPAGQLTLNAMMGLGGPNVGQELSVTVDENNMVIDVHKAGDGSVEQHRIVRGRLTGQGRDAIKLRTPEGEKSYPLAPSVRNLRHPEEGGVVTAEINEAGQVIDPHPLDVTLAMARTPRLTTGMHIMLSGTAWTIRSGILFVRTPFGTSTVHQASSRHDVKVGDHLICWVDEDNYVIDVHSPADGSHHQVIRGRASYVDEDRRKVRLFTPDGVKVFPLDEGADPSTVLPEHAPVTVEINEAGKVIDMHTDRKGSE